MFVLNCAEELCLVALTIVSKFERKLICAFKNDMRNLANFHRLMKQRFKFPKTWKKPNVVPVHKKEDKMLVKNYRPICLLPIFGKMFERVIYNSLFNYFQSNRLFTPSQSGFLPGDSCIAQLLSIIHEVQTDFDENPTVDRGVLLDISKTFDIV